MRNGIRTIRIISALKFQRMFGSGNTTADPTIFPQPWTHKKPTRFMPANYLRPQKPHCLLTDCNSNCCQRDLTKLPSNEYYSRIITSKYLMDMPPQMGKIKMSLVKKCWQCRIGFSPPSIAVLYFQQPWKCEKQKCRFMHTHTSAIIKFLMVSAPSHLISRSCKYLFPSLSRARRHNVLPNARLFSFWRFLLHLLCDLIPILIFALPKAQSIAITKEMISIFKIGVHKNIAVPINYQLFPVSKLRPGLNWIMLLFVKISDTIWNCC